ncbi:MAG TPA: NAD(P)/FAD-dependent oxidoreductase [bacterium]|nr:NAD(P)/FAD-dependent oxidoreductase [bacterium]HPP11485.1 NAD(P)/FAD-dependent oxidoreductase [bacterium]
MEKKVEVLIVGAGPAGLSAAIEVARGGARVLVVDENGVAGGQLFKQIHRFFGSRDHSAGVRGFEIGTRLLRECENAGVEIMLNSVVWGLFPDMTAGVVFFNKHNVAVRAERIILSCGASENTLNFPGWTLPGVMGAGAAQTMMNIHRVLPGKEAIMVGSGNVGLIVGYQLIQAGCQVKAVLEILPEVGGYKVHANKLARLGVEILTSWTVVEARGREKVEEVVISRVDSKLQPMAGSKRTISADLVCMAVGLSPLAELAWMAGCRFGYFPLLGGFVPLHGANLETTLPGIYVAGDISGIEEASTAMEEGKLAAVSVLESLKRISPAEAAGRRKVISQSLVSLRRGPYGDFRQKEKERIFREFEKVKEGSGGYH